MDETHRGLSRRGLLGVSAATAAALPLATGGGAAKAARRSKRSPGPGAAALELNVNGHRRALTLDPRTTLLDALREGLQLTGAKKGCDHGQCGACTVLADGRRVLSCLTLAASVRGPILTIEGLAPPGGPLHPMQQAFIDADAFQCGYCTPGQILSAVACVGEGHAGTDEEVREYMSGNLCRCGAYPHIVAAVRSARTKMSA